MGFYRGPQFINSDISLYIDPANSRCYNGSGVSLNDLSENGNNGTMISGVTYSNDNHGIFNLNGTNGYISFENNLSFNNSVFTFSAWLKNNATNLNWNRILSKKNLYYDTDGYEITLSTGTSTTLYIYGSSDVFATIDNIGWINTGWHNLTVIFNGNQVSVYFDGIFKGSGTIDTVISNNRPLYVGKIESETTTLWNGSIGGILLYDKVLTSDEIVKNFNAFKNRYQV